MKTVIKVIEELNIKEIRNIHINNFKYIVKLLVEIYNINDKTEILEKTKKLEQYGYKYWLDFDEWVWTF